MAHEVKTQEIIATQNILAALKVGDLTAAAFEMAKQHDAPAAVITPEPGVETGALPTVALLKYAVHYTDHGMFISELVAPNGDVLHFAPPAA